MVYIYIFETTNKWYRYNMCEIWIIQCTFTAGSSKVAILLLDQKVWACGRWDRGLNYRFELLQVDQTPFLDGFGTSIKRLERLKCEIYPNTLLQRQALKLQEELWLVVSTSPFLSGTQRLEIMVRTVNVWPLLELELSKHRFYGNKFVIKCHRMIWHLQVW